jgi:hypothetical protein
MVHQVQQQLGGQAATSSSWRTHQLLCIGAYSYSFLVFGLQVCAAGSCLRVWGSLLHPCLSNPPLPIHTHAPCTNTQINRSTCWAPPPLCWPASWAWLRQT